MLSWFGVSTSFNVERYSWASGANQEYNAILPGINIHHVRFVAAATLGGVEHPSVETGFEIIWFLIQRVDTPRLKQVWKGIQHHHNHERVAPQGLTPSDFWKGNLYLFYPRLLLGTFQWEHFWPTIGNFLGATIFLSIFCVDSQQ